MSRVSLAHITLLALPSYFLTVEAFPSLFSEERGCKEVLPKKGYGGHKDPRYNDGITFVLSKDDKPVTEWVPGTVYQLSTGDGNIEDEVNAWMHATSGKLQGGSGSQGQCENGWYSYRAATTQTMEWTAPEEKACVLFSTAQAADSEAAYETNTVEICASGYSEADALKSDISNQDPATQNSQPKVPGTMLMVIFMVIVVAAIVAQYFLRAQKNTYHLVN